MIAIALSHQSLNCNRNFSVRSTLRGIDSVLQIANCRYRCKNKSIYLNLYFVIGSLSSPFNAKIEWGDLHIALKIEKTQGINLALT